MFLGGVVGKHRLPRQVLAYSIVNGLPVPTDRNYIVGELVCLKRFFCFMTQ